MPNMCILFCVTQEIITVNITISKNVDIIIKLDTTPYKVPIYKHCCILIGLV